MLSIATVERSFVGGRETNEDCTAVATAGSHVCLVLSDGAGGHAGGARAARIAVDKVVAGFRARPPADARDLAELLLDAHDAVLAAQRAAPGTAAAMHATIVVLVLDPNGRTALWGHVGDSRLYVLRHGVVLAVTRDDSVVQWMVDSGLMAADQARNHPRKNRLLAALGADTDIHPTVQARPFRIQAGDAFLLCTDGWWDGLAGGAIENEFARAANVEAWVDAMAAHIAGRAVAHHDNYSAIGCWISNARQREATVTSGTEWEREST